MTLLTASACHRDATDVPRAAARAPLALLVMVAGTVGVFAGAALCVWVLSGAALTLDLAGIGCF